MRRRKRWGMRILLGVILVAVLTAGAGIWFISPAKELDLGYEPVDMKAKLIKMLENRQPDMTLSKEEVAQLSKKNLVKYIRTHDLPVSITGADFRMNGTRMTADMNGRWGFVPFGATLEFEMAARGSKLQLEHVSTHIRGREIPDSVLKLSPIEISLKDYLPDVVTVRKVDFLDDGMKLTFKIDWLALPSLL